MLAFTTLAVSAALASTVIASSHDSMGHRDSHQGRLKLNKLKANHAKRQGAVPAGALLLTVANGTDPINFASMMSGSAPAANATTPSYNGTALWFSQTAGKLGACLVQSTDADMVIGISTEFWNNTGVPSPLCGHQVFVSSGDKNITATLFDASGSNYTTLSVAAFQALGSLDAGMIPISYHFLNTSSSLLPNSTTNTSSLALVAASPAAAPVAPLVALPVASNPNGIPITPVQAASSSATTPAPNAVDVAAAAAAASSSSKAAADRAYASSTSAAAAAASSKAAADAAWSAQQAASSSAAAAAASQNAVAQVQANAKSAAAAAIAPIATPVTSGAKVYTGGHGTYFYQNGVAGACGAVSNDWAKVIAIDQAMYNGGKNCGRSILITRTDTGKQVTAVVADMCPTCDNDTSLDLSLGAFNAIASESEGLINISWQFV